MPRNILVALLCTFLSQLKKRHDIFASLVKIIRKMTRCSPGIAIETENFGAVLVVLPCEMTEAADGKEK